MYPKLLAVVLNADFDDRLINEVMGFLFRCSTQAAAYITDYVVDIGTAYSIAQSRTTILTDACVQAGLMEVVDLDGVRGWKIIEDPEFLHMKTEEEIRWEKQRKADNGNPALVIPVRLRDGDACRYCGKVVKWTARKGKLGGTYDHRDPGQPGTVDTLVVCCGECNAKRGSDPDADKRVPLLPAPHPPYFDKSTVEWINGSTWARDNGIPKLPPKRDKFVPAGSVPPGHEAHVPVPGELLLESPVETTTDSQSDGHDSGVDSQTLPPMPAWMSDAVPAPAPDAQSGSDGTGDSTSEPMSETEAPSSQTATGSTPVGDVPAPDESTSVDAGVPDDARQRSGVGPAEKSDLPKKLDPAGRQCAGVGNAGSGRDGTGLFGNGEVRDGEVDGHGESRHAQRKKRRRRKRR